MSSNGNVIKLQSDINCSSDAIHPRTVYVFNIFETFDVSSYRETYKYYLQYYFKYYLQYTNIHTEKKNSLQQKYYLIDWSQWFIYFKLKIS